MKQPYAIITGAARGIGYALAKQCLLQQISVIAVDIDAEALTQATAELQLFGSISKFVIDLTNQKQIQTFAADILQQYGAPHYLFNNAGIGGEMRPIWQQDIENFKQVMDVNFYSAFYMIQAFLPAMIQEKIQGKIINIASMASFYSAPLINSYVISKHSIMALSECLYHDLQAIDSSIQVSVVCPGGVKTSILDQKVQTVLNNEDMLTDMNQLSKNFLIKFAKIIKKGMSADAVAEIIFAGLTEKQFYIFTHPEMMDVIKQRLNAVIEMKQPQALGL